MIQNPELGKGKKRWEWMLDQEGLSWKTKLKKAINQVVMNSEEFEDFLTKCADYGVIVDYNPDHKIDLKFMLAEQKERNPRVRFIRARTLGGYYETETIKKRIAQFVGGMSYTPRASRPECMLICEVTDATVSWVAECLLVENPDGGRGKM